MISNGRLDVTSSCHRDLLSGFGKLERLEGPTILQATIINVESRRHDESVNSELTATQPGCMALFSDNSKFVCASS